MKPAAGTPEFIRKLLGRKYLDPDLFVDYKNGDEVNGYNLETDGFKKPIVVRNKSGLRMKVPPPNFNLHDVVDFTDPEIQIAVIDVENQCDSMMPLGEFVDKFYEKPRKRILNVLSFEYSRTKLATYIRPPHVVKELSLVDNCWAEPADEDDEVGPVASEKPYVQKYCLMSMAGSYTDFHIDFGGSSVWYHVLWGEKIFYVIPPSKPYLDAYWAWNGLIDNRRVFYLDTLDTPIPVATLRLKAGDTVLLPSGWIHAVYTPADSLVFGGNFLTQFSIPLQLHVYHMEIAQKTEQRFLFPAFEKLHWYAADVILGKLTNCLYAGQEPPPYLLKAASALINPLQQWLENRKDLPKGERNYYLPARTYLQYAYSTLIVKLEDMIHSFISRSPSYHHASSAKRPRKSKHQQRMPSGDEGEKDVESDSTDPLVDESEGYSGIHARSTLPESSRGCRFSSGSPYEDDAEDDGLREVLDAVPELRSSKLVGDEYVFSLTESMDESVRKHRRRKAFSKNSQKSDDPDPTWTTVSSSTLARRRRLKLSSRDPSYPPFPRPHNVSQPFNTQHSLLSSPHPGDTGTQNSSVRRGKSSKTVRQRLAKRLGL
ncbi:unnamed protein product [Hymenolepis diminuta]|uniref:JmjC domain-containing protein n=1 Tax=Hymenolepis diminuta TaxID=6216 RepID=A0A564YNP6_HYMDI|nr:unnamed protein product [Hymenolepis diminuta]